jgi:hypothetical protein
MASSLDSPQMRMKPMLALSTHTSTMLPVFTYVHQHVA